ncbi:MAG: fibronectin type III-like domain-contianing protein, partial [Clostridia bacterium]|nr:fibronectin type III-like domain-contianing protein [Clostridia bacterium]
PVKELKGFEKIELKKGEEKTVVFTLDRRAFAYWDDINHDWCVNNGVFRIHIGASSADIRLTGEIKINAEPVQKKITPPPMVQPWKERAEI